MWTLWFWALLVSGLIGLSIKLVFSRLQITNDVTGITGRNVFQISWVEFAIVFAISAVLIVPITTKIGLHLAKASKLTYQEFWGGYETATLKSSRTCTRDGACHDDYDCDPHEVSTVVADADGKGFHTETHTEYHSCPVATVENYYTIRTTLGDYDLGYTFNSPAEPWRSSHGLDGTPQGDPTQWVEASARIAAHDPGPVTAVRPYDNYILASTHTILHKYSDAVDRYKKAGLLPDPVVKLKQPIYNYYYADKMQFVGLPASGAWSLALAELNAAVGSALQGDVHVVAIDAAKVSNPDEYAGAVNAYWQSPTLGRRALSKNGIGLVVGVTGNKITWARAFTGMPVGNDSLTQDLANNVTGQPFTPAIFGHPVGTITQGKNTKGKLTDIVKVANTGSPVERALWGPHKFVRVSMAHGGSSYKYLGNEIQPSSGQKMMIIFIATLFGMLLWAIALFTTIGEKRETNDRHIL